MAHTDRVSSTTVINPGEAGFKEAVLRFVQEHGPILDTRPTKGGEAVGGEAEEFLFSITVRATLSSGAYTDVAGWLSKLPYPSAAEELAMLESGPEGVEKVEKFLHAQMAADILLRQHSAFLDGESERRCDGLGIAFN